MKAFNMNRILAGIVVPPKLTNQRLSLSQDGDRSCDGVPDTMGGRWEIVPSTPESGGGGGSSAGDAAHNVANAVANQQQNSSGAASKTTRDAGGSGSAGW